VQKIDASNVISDEEMTLFCYSSDGTVDLDLCRNLQIEANKLKIDNQWVPEEHIKILAYYMVAAGLQPKKRICRGTRRGNEQLWFHQNLPPLAIVIGTEISNAAKDFRYTIQWDFHEVDPAGMGKIDFIYSNSWDNAHDLEKAFAGWASCLKPGGFMMLDHRWNYRPDRVSAMDPFGFSEAGSVKMLNRVASGVGEVIKVIKGGKHRQKQIRTVMFRARQV
jgi:hypothetical protein